MRRMSGVCIAAGVSRAIGSGRLSMTGARLHVILLTQGMWTQVIVRIRHAFEWV